jgi:hypothetical protein
VASDFHGLVCALVLGTDMAHHQRGVDAWSRRVVKGGGYDFGKTDDRREVLRMLLHAADLGAQAKPMAIAERWAAGIQAEFKAQGEDERRLGLPQSPLCEANPDVHRGTLAFLDFVCIPLFQVVAQVIPEVPQTLALLKKYRAAVAAKTTSAAAGYVFPTKIAVAPNDADRAMDQVAAERARLEELEQAVALRRQSLEDAAQKAQAANEDVARREDELHQRMTTLLQREQETKHLDVQLDALRAKEEEIRRLHQSVVDVQVRAVMIEAGADAVAAEKAALAQAAAVMAERESRVRALEAESQRKQSLLDDREVRMTELGDQLRQLAESIKTDKERAEKLLAREAQIEAQARQTALHASNSAHLAARTAAAAELEQRLALQHAAVGDALAVLKLTNVRAHHEHLHVVRCNTEMQTILEREALVGEAIAQSRFRRQRAAQARVIIGNDGSPLARLEQCIYQFTHQISSMAQ